MERDTLVRAAGPANRMRVHDPRNRFAEAEDSAGNPLPILHALLRGRYRWVCLLAAIGATIGAITAYSAVPRTFESVGLIRIRPNVPRILYQSESNGVMPMFQSYVDSQASLIRSDAVIQQAMENEKWQAFGRGEINSATTAAFASQLEVRHPKGSELIQVAFTDADPTVPAAAVRATIEAYVKLYGERDAKAEAQTLQILEERRTALTTEQDGLKQQMLEIANQYGSNALDKLVQYKAQELNEIRAELRRVKLAILAAETHPATAAAAKLSAGPTTGPSIAKTPGVTVKPSVTATNPPAMAVQAAAARGAREVIDDAMTTVPGDAAASTTAAEVAQIPVEVLAGRDWLMRMYIQQRMEATRNMESIQSRMGPNHPTLRDYKARLATIDQDIEAHATVLRANIVAVAAGGDPFGEEGGMSVSGHTMLDPAISVERFRAQEQNLQSFYDASRAEMAELGSKNLLMESLRNDANDVQRRLDEIKNRTEQLSVESASSGRVEVMDYGNRPVVPTGNRRGVWTGAGGTMGLILGVGVVAFVGLLDRRRVLDMADANSSSPRQRGGRFPILGAIPSLNNDSPSNAQVQFTAEAIHRIRARLQIQQGLTDCRALALTSPSSGDGKTSMTIALGMSFAAGGAKTLLIEGDVVGAGLTGRLNAKVSDDLPRILHDEGLLTAEHLEVIRRRVREGQKPVEEVLLDSGWVNEADVARAEVLQSKRKVGLLDALGGRPLAECVGPCHVPGLDVLPLGSAKQADIPQIALESVRRLLKQAKEQYDTILIDTGPILGSLEAAVMTAAADGVLLMVSRGDQRATLEAAIADLESLHVNVIGAIYNRAQDNETTPGNASFHASRMFHSRPRQGGDMPTAAPEPILSGVGEEDRVDGKVTSTTASTSRIGPVAAAVADAGNRVGGHNGKH